MLPSLLFTQLLSCFNFGLIVLFQVLRAVNLRESRLAEVERALQAFQWHRGLDTDAVGAVSSLAGLRDASLEVVRAVVVSYRTQASDDDRSM